MCIKGIYNVQVSILMISVFNDILNSGLIIVLVQYFASFSINPIIEYDCCAFSLSFQVQI